MALGGAADGDVGGSAAVDVAAGGADAASAALDNSAIGGEHSIDHKQVSSNAHRCEMDYWILVEVHR